MIKKAHMLMKKGSSLTGTYKRKEPKGGFHAYDVFMELRYKSSLQLFSSRRIKREGTP